jgi:hypothetical protein
VTSVLTLASVGASTLGSSGAYTPPEDLQVLAPTELWNIWYNVGGETTVST